MITTHGRVAGGDAPFRPEVGKQAEAMDGEACVK
jgi:hypothetical protein